MADNKYTIQVDQQTPATWSSLVDEFADASLYQTWAYGAVSWGEKHLSHLVLRRGNEVVAAAQLRVLRTPVVGCGVAYLRWGPMCQRRNSEFDPSVMQAMAGALRDEYVKRRGLFLRLMPHAVIGDTRADAYNSAFAGFQSEPFRPGQTYRTFLLELSPPLDQLRKDLDQKWRNCLNKSERNSLRVVESTSEEAFFRFLELYDQMLARKQFSTSTDVHGFLRIQAGLPESQRMKVLLCEQDGEAVAGLVGTAVGDTGIYLHGATSERGMKSQGAYLLQWAMIRLLKEAGAKYYNLGGINPETNPGVYHFKAGMSGKDVLYLPAFTICESAASAAAVRWAEFARRTVRKLKSRHAAPAAPKSAVPRPASEQPAGKSAL